MVKAKQTISETFIGVMQAKYRMVIPKNVRNLLHIEQGDSLRVTIEKI